MSDWIAEEGYPGLVNLATGASITCGTEDMKTWHITSESSRVIRTLASFDSQDEAQKAFDWLKRYVGAETLQEFIDREMLLAEG